MPTMPARAASPCRTTRRCSCGSTSSLVGHGEPIIRPLASESLDYEAELAVVIGRRGKHVTRAEALDYVAGYTVFNDASVRDYQRRTAQWTPGKNFDATGALGPMLVTPDELPPGARGTAHRVPAQRPGHAVREHRRHDLRCSADHRDLSAKS